MQIDITSLARDVTTFLAPFLPFLAEMGKQAAGSASKKFGEEAWNTATRIWTKIGDRLQSRSGVEEIQALTKDPSDGEARSALTFQLRSLLSQDAELANAINELLKESSVSSAKVTAQGERSVAVGGNNLNSPIVTGDNNLHIDKN